jgi:hypothetical protein
MTAIFPTPHTGSADEDARVSSLQGLLADVSVDEDAIEATRADSALWLPPAARQKMVADAMASLGEAAAVVNQKRGA